MTTVSSGPTASQSTASRVAQLAHSVLSGKGAKKSEDKKDDDKAEDKKDDDKAEDKKDDDKAEDKKDDKADKETEDDDDTEKSEDDGDDDEAKAKDGDDDSDDDDKADKKAKAARLRERGRISAIINSKAAKRSEHSMAMAMSLAFGTSMNRGEALAVLVGMPDAPAAAATKPADPLRDRMQQEPKPDVGADAPNASAGKTGPSLLAAQIIAAGKKRRGEDPTK